MRELELDPIRAEWEAAWQSAERRLNAALKSGDAEILIYRGQARPEIYGKQDAALGFNVARGNLWNGAGQMIRTHNAKVHVRLLRPDYSIALPATVEIPAAILGAAEPASADWPLNWTAAEQRLACHIQDKLVAFVDGGLQGPKPKPDDFTAEAKADDLSRDRVREIFAVVAESDGRFAGLNARGRVKVTKPLK